jgi:hypothetical protein
MQNDRRRRDRPLLVLYSHYLTDPYKRLVFISRLTYLDCTLQQSTFSWMIRQELLTLF